MGEKSPNQGPIFCAFFPGKIRRKIFLQKMLEKIGIFRGKKSTKNWPLLVTLVGPTRKLFKVNENKIDAAKLAKRKKN
jgi:hypothetical protein